MVYLAALEFNTEESTVELWIFPTCNEALQAAASPEARAKISVGVIQFITNIISMVTVERSCSSCCGTWSISFSGIHQEKRLLLYNTISFEYVKKYVG